MKYRSAEMRMQATFKEHGFLPPRDPARSFGSGTELAALDELGHDLPSLLHEPDFRTFARELAIPKWRAPADPILAEDLLHLYYVRLGFLASGYINQVGQPPATVLPQNIAVPLCEACRLLSRPPILSYDGYALYNWKRFDAARPIALGNIDTLQDFVHLYDEHWFILIHVEIEAIAAQILAAMDDAARGASAGDSEVVNTALSRIGAAVWKQVEILWRIPEKMDPAIYYKTFRPYIRFFEHVVYEGVDSAPLDYRGETGAQSSIMPTLIAFMKIPHRQSMLTDHLADMRNFMPAEHRALIEEVQAMPDVRPLAEKEAFNNVLEAMASFRETHFGWAMEYIHKRTQDPRGTGGTPFMQWLKQLADETRAHKIA
jgi:indoleamine 2,3-dioxygenase